MDSPQSRALALFVRALMGSLRTRRALAIFLLMGAPHSRTVPTVRVQSPERPTSISARRPAPTGTPQAPMGSPQSSRPLAIFVRALMPSLGSRRPAPTEADQAAPQAPSTTVVSSVTSSSPLARSPSTTEGAPSEGAPSEGALRGLYRTKLTGLIVVLLLVFLGQHWADLKKVFDKEQKDVLGVLSLLKDALIQVESGYAAFEKKELVKLAAEKLFSFLIVFFAQIKD